MGPKNKNKKNKNKQQNNDNNEIKPGDNAQT